MASSSGVRGGGREDVFSFQIEEEDLSELTVGHEGEEEGIDDRWCLVGRFLSHRVIDFDKMQNILASLWQPGMGMFVKKLEENRFLFQFYHEVDIQRVINGSPWTFDRMQLIIQRLPVGGDPNLIQLNHLDIWVQIHDVKPDCMKEATVRGIGNTMGKFVENDPKNFIGVWRDYLRVRVTLDIRKPLRRRLKLTHENGSWFWVHFKYERVPTFCFICGVMGHSDKFCSKLFQQPLDQIAKPYGDFMIAQPQRSYKHLGARWLRNKGWQPAGSTDRNEPGQNSSQPNMKTNPTDGVATNQGEELLLNNNDDFDMHNGRMESDQEACRLRSKKGNVNISIHGKNKEKDILIGGNAEVVLYDNKKRKVGEEEVMGHVGQAQSDVGLPKNSFVAGLGSGSRQTL
ncbi:uncharacterized protein LOC133034398 [Cannabis sativa]|uniref:uncharacterized protein LOC133034398 n=1 Tax=Cannabis sativa TaxID=3483 RepID=UPI0029CA1978|nr:uncharacterized protein LOC133034398 [Cannabis sativa]